MSNLFKPKTIALAKLAKLPVHQHPALFAQQAQKPMQIQRLQIEGEIPFQKGQYHSTFYQSLISKLKQSRKSFRTTNSQDGRAQISRDQFSLWDNYVNEGIQRLPKRKQIDNNKIKNQLYEAYTGTKQRTQEKISCHRLLDFHDHYARAFNWDIEIHPRILLQMIHPHFGYLLNYKKKVTLEEYTKFLEAMVFASQERYLGQTLHSNQISAFNFWKLYTPEPQLKIADFCLLLNAFKFSTTTETFDKQFKYTLKDTKGEILSTNKVDQIGRFDLFRKIFLERGL